jgi:hypothetical protein
MIVGVAALGERYFEGEDVDGVRLSYGWWGEYGPLMTGGLLLWAEGSRGETQRILGAGADFEMISIVAGPVRIMPRFKAGFEHRQENPNDGWSFLVGIGAEVAVWVRPGWQIVAAVDRDLAYPAGASNQGSVELRYAWEQ